MALFCACCLVALKLKDEHTAAQSRALVHAESRRVCEFTAPLILKSIGCHWLMLETEDTTFRDMLHAFRANERRTCNDFGSTTTSGIIRTSCRRGRPAKQNASSVKILERGSARHSINASLEAQNLQAKNSYSPYLWNTLPTCPMPTREREDIKRQEHRPGDVVVDLLREPLSHRFHAKVVLAHVLKRGCHHQLFGWWWW